LTSQISLSIHASEPRAVKKDGVEKMVSFWEPFLLIESMMDDERFMIPINRDLCCLKYADSDGVLNQNSLVLFYPETGAVYLIEKSENT